ncbi:MAG: 4Fe-4S dicluster domain-containing protein [Planctomycetota bacterium]
MITLDDQLDFDEEKEFGAPVAPHSARPPRTVAERVGVAMVAIGTIALVAMYFAGPFLGGWGSLLVGYFLPAVGGVLAFVARYRGRPVGIYHDGIAFSSTTHRGVTAWLLAFGITGFYVALYFRDDLTGALGHDFIAPLVTITNPLAQLLASQDASHWFLYGFLYTLSVTVFGVRMWMRYRHNRYQRLRTVSVVFFQLVLAFLIPNLLILFQSKEYYFTYFWPLKPEYLYPSAWQSAEGTVAFFFYWSAFMSLIATPILTYYYGKRWYCSWVCGCGGLAETLGDPWRQLSDKSTRAWRIERWMIHSVLVLVIALTVVLWVNSAQEGRVLGDFSQAFSTFYGLWITMIFSGVVGVGFYPLLGSRVWCRFGCPMAAVLGIIQRVKSRFRITTNGSQCMSCGNCSTFCEMGIDVRAYAQRGENIIRASCVGCGVCSAVCPRGVLKLENGPEGTRFKV